jgi:hypothetical protein
VHCLCIVCVWFSLEELGILGVYHWIVCPLSLSFEFILVMIIQLKDNTVERSFLKESFE